MTVVYTRVVVDEVIIHDGNLNISQQYNDRLYVGWERKENVHCFCPEQLKGWSCHYKMWKPEGWTEVLFAFGGSVSEAQFWTCYFLEIPEGDTE